MALGWKKLKIGDQHGTAEQAVGYLADPQARGDYYTEGGSFMRWLATPRARTFFGLGDQVSRVTLAALLSGKHPADGKLIRRPGPDRTMVGGIDLTVNPAPKSVSILWAMGSDELRAELEQLVILSVNAAVGRMLDEVALIRERYGPGPRDVRHVKAQDYVGVQALHTTARLAKGRDIPDPQLHVHNVLIGGLDWAGRLRAIDTYPVAQFQAELYAQASADLAERLRQRGWRIERQLVRSSRGKVKRAAWEVAGVPPELVKAMSRRRGEVEELRDQYRQATGREPSGARWERFLEQHRGPKARRTSAEMYAAWAEEAAEYGFGPGRVIAMEAEAAATRAAGVEKRDESSEAAVQLKCEILADLCREHALVARRELDKLVIQRSMGLMHPYDAMGVAAEMFGDGDLLASTDGRVTCWQRNSGPPRRPQSCSRPSPPPPRTDQSLRRSFGSRRTRAALLMTSSAER